MVLTLPESPAGSCIVLVSYTGAFTCACILFFYGSSFFFCQPYNLMYLQAAFDRFQWNLVTMINVPARICHMTLDRVKGHPRSQGSKMSFLPKTHQVLRIMQHGPVTHVCASPWPTLQMLLDHFFIWGHLGSQGSNIRSESKYL